MIQVRARFVRRPFQACAVESGTLNDICRSFMEKASAELVWSFYSKPKRAENRVGEMPYVVGDDGLGLGGNGGCHGMDVVHVGQGDGAQRFRIGIEIRAWKRILTRLQG